MPGEQTNTEEFDCFLSHNSKDKPAVRELAEALRQRGIKVWLDEDELIPGGDWQQTLEEMIETLQSAAVLVGPDGIGPWQNAEMRACLSECVDRGLRVIPVLLPGVSKKPRLPLFLKRFTWLDLREGHLTQDGLDRLEWAISGEKPDRLKKKIGSKGDHSKVEVAPSRLPITGSILVGRSKELRRLTSAWKNPKTNLISIVAWGGVGKTALVLHWIGQMAADGYRGAEKVFDWTFHSQGARDQATSADQFLDRALRFFEDKDPTQGGPYEKGERLAGLVARSRNLLVLDGLEPLQHPPGTVEGSLKDPALEALIRGLSLHNPGLCILTTREKVAEVAHLSATTAPRIDLEHLSPGAGALLLKNLKVKGTKMELEEASQNFAGHALALTLLGTYLAEVHSGDARHWKEVPLLDESAPKGGHARRVMRSYHKWLGEGLEWSLMQLMGIFDRPAKGEEIQALLAEPPIEDLTDAILKQKRPARKRALSRLRRLRLLAEPPPDDLEGMDAHPLLREYLSEQLQQQHPEACREGHKRLYQQLKQTSKEFPDTLEEMMPLYQAVVHGCRAGLHQESMDEVYWARIARKEEAFAVRQLGAFGADLAVVSNFFDHPWNVPSGRITDAAQAFLLNQAGFHLRALGRLSEAAKPMRAALEAFKCSEDWKNAARQAGNLSEIYLSLGNLTQGVEDAQHGVEMADRSRDVFEKLKECTKLADALHQSGDLAQVRSLFQRAEQMQRKLQPQFPLLYSLPGFRYSDFLLGECEVLAWVSADPQSDSVPSCHQALSRCREVRNRAARTLDWVENVLTNMGPLHVALNHLTLGRTYLLEAALDAPYSNLLSQAQHHLDCAVTGLRQAGTTHHQPRALIARAQFHRVQFQHSDKESFAHAQQDLDEAAQIASRGPMPLFLADVHLEQSRLQYAQGNRDQARQSLSEARKLIQKHAYHRRDPELEALEKLFGE